MEVIRRTKEGEERSLNKEEDGRKRREEEEKEEGSHRSDRIRQGETPDAAAPPW